MTRDERRAHRPIQLTVTETVGGWVATWSVFGFTHPEMGAIARSKQEAVAWAHKFFRRDLETKVVDGGVPLMAQSKMWWFLQRIKMMRTYGRRMWCINGDPDNMMFQPLQPVDYVPITIYLSKP